MSESSNNSRLKVFKFWTGALVVAAMPASVLAEDLTAGVVMNKMSVDERSGFIAGVVEGLAYARFAKDGDEEPGMKCIYGWYYENNETLPKIYEAFDYFKDYLPGAVIAAMVEKECGT